MTQDNKPKLSDRAYAAGFLDGEGCIFVGWQNRQWGYRHILIVRFSQTRPQSLQYLASIWGGKVYGPYPRRGLSSPVWEWFLQDSSAERFLSSVRPFVCEKADQVWLALEYRAQTRNPSRRPLSEEALALRQGFRLALSYLKGSGAHGKNAIAAARS